MNAIDDFRAAMADAGLDPGHAPILSDGKRAARDSCGLAGVFYPTAELERFLAESTVETAASGPDGERAAR